MVRARCIPITCSCYVLFSVKKHEIMVLACQVGPFHLTLTQINSEMNCIAKNKCPESQKLDTRRRSENLIAISPRVMKSNNIVCTHYVKVFGILCLCIILFDTSKVSENLTFIQFHFIHSNCVRKNRSCRRRLRDPSRILQRTYACV